MGEDLESSGQPQAPWGGDGPPVAEPEDRPRVAVSIVGIGASAGGLEAFIQLFRALPADTGLGFVLVQHLAPAHPSALAEILSRVTPMPVTEVQDEPLVQPDHVYVIPPGRDMTIARGTLHLLTRATGGQQHPIDLFFRSLAEDQGTQAIGVVLSGSATDGTLGLGAIKEEGGITFAQDESAQQPSMPRSAIAAGCVDFILPPDAIAQEIARIARHSPIEPAPATEAADGALLSRIVQLLHHDTGIDFSQYRAATVSRRIARRIIVHRLGGMSDYVRLLERAPGEVAALHQDLLIGVTSFFRDPEAFAVLQAAVFPRLLDRRAGNDPVRMWALGCSTGEEAYSLAMALTEVAEAGGHRTPIQVFATDLNAAGIEKARAGVYPKDIASVVSPERLRRFFVDIDGHYRLVKSIRDLCVFARHDVLADPPFSRVDLVSCRNLLIYLEPHVQQRVMAILHYALRPAGVLWLGGSETAGSNRDLFDVENADHRIFVKRPGLGAAMHLPPYFAASRPSRDVSPPTSPVPAPPDIRRNAERFLAGKYAPPSVLISDDLDILHLWGDTGPFLSPAPGKASLNLLKMLRDELLISVRAALGQARAGGRTVRSASVRLTVDGQARDVTVEVAPVPRSPGHGGAFLILFEEGSGAGLASPGQAERDAPMDTRPDPVTVDLQGEAARLAAELAATREYLQSVIDQQEAATEELQAAHEESQSTNEELQSINEELQTSKEEIQSSNEELATVNDELNHRNVELARINNDLVNLLGAVQLPIVILGPDLRIRRFTPASEPLFNLTPADLARPIREIRTNLAVPDLEDLIKGAIDTMVLIEREVQDRHGRWHLLRIRPYRTLENQIDGAVIVVIDIDGLKRLHEYAEGIVATVRAPLVVLDEDLRVQMASAAFYELFGTTAAMAEGRPLHVVAGGQLDLPLLRQMLEHILPAGRQLIDFEVDIAGAGGLRKTLLMNARRLVTGSDQRPSILLAIEEVTARRVQEAASRQHLAELAASDRAKDEFLAMLAHELRNPLGALASAMQLAQLPAATPAMTARAWHVMNRQANTLARLVDDLLDVARLAQGRIYVQKERLDLGALVDRAADSLDRDIVARGQVLTVALPREPLHIEGDPVRLDQVVTNLVGNASKFTPRNGRIWVTVESAPPEGPGASSTTAVLRVRDDGVGIEPPLLPRVFDLFTQADHSLARAPGGLGIGLTIVQRIVALHGGQVEARSAGRDQGSEFIVRLPVFDSATATVNEAQASATPAQPPPERGRRRVLVVDDNEDSTQSLAALLEINHLDVRVASDGPSALLIAAAFTPEIVVLDIGLPGMSGYEVARQMRQLPGLAAAFLVAVTGYGQERDRERTRLAGFDQHLTKPVDHAALLRLFAALPPAAE